MDIERRLEKLEKQNQHQRVALALLTVALCAIVVMGATEEKDGFFDTVTAKNIYVKNEAGEVAIGLGAFEGYGTVRTYSPTGKLLVGMGVTPLGDGAVETFSPTGKVLVRISATENGNGTVTTFSPTGKEIVEVGATVEGHGTVTTYSPTGKEIIHLRVRN